MAYVYRYPALYFLEPSLTRLATSYSKIAILESWPATLRLALAIDP